MSADKSLITWRTFGFWGLLTAASLALLSGCSKSDDSADSSQPKFEVADSDDGGTGAVRPALDGTAVKAAAPEPAKGNMLSQPPSLAVDELEQVTVPDGTPEQLLTFTHETGQKILDYRAEAGGHITGAALTREIALFQAIIEASDKILADSSATLDQRKGAIDSKSGAMSWLSQRQPEENWSGRVRTFGAELAADSEPEIAVIGKSIVFGTDLGAFQRGLTRDPAPLMAQLRALLQDEARGNSVMGVALQAMNVLRGLNHETEAREVLDLVIAAYKDSDDPGLANEARRLAEEALFLDTRIRVAFDGIISGRAGSDAEFLSALQKVLGQPELGTLTLEQGARFIIALQEAGQYALARQVCQMYQEAYAKISDAALKSNAETITTMALRRMELIGKPLTVEARRTDGTSLDFSQYAGKPVLLVFFAAYSPQCQQELFNVRKAYEKFHSQGLEVITVSLDPNPQLLQQFLAQAQLPWATVINNELAEQCGADMVPLGVLIDASGKVDDIFVQGSQLEQKLEKVLGAPDAGQQPAAPKAGPVDGQSRRVPRRPIRPLGAAFVGTWAWPADELRDEPEEPATKQQGPGDSDEAALDQVDDSINPYLARDGLSPAKLIDFLFDMQDKPKSIRRRAGFAEAMIDAADRVLRSDAQDKYKRIAIDTKLNVLHEAACLGDEAADEQLQAFVTQLAGRGRPELAPRIEFFQLERRVLDADQLDVKEIPALLDDLQKYFEAQPELKAEHLRMASATVHAVNRLEQDDAREAQFTRFGELFAKSDDAQLARYGKKLAKGGKGRASDLVGKPLVLEGMTDLGVPLDWQGYRDKVVLVDFWATWCGPCLQELPHVRKLYDELSESGFDVVAVSLDEDLEALAKFLKENKVPWPNLVGQEARELATKYDVRGIPTMMLVDQQGQVVAVSHKVEDLKPKLKELLATAAR